MTDEYRPRLPRPVRPVLVALAVAGLAPLLVAGSDPAAAVALVAVPAAAFWWLDAWPRAAMAVVLAAGVVQLVVVPAAGAGPVFVALCAFAWLRPAPESLAALAGTVTLLMVADGRWPAAALWAGAAVLAWSWGALGRAAGARRRAERRRAALEERARIARELHDVLSHTVSVMVVQAAAADDVFDHDPALARQALRRGEAAGRQALAELRWFLRSVRSDEDGSPQPALADLDRLAETVRQAGLPVELRWAGTAEVPAGVQLSAYRIVQESLTNSLRHARAGHAEVSVHAGPGEVCVEIRDDGRGGSPGTGNGIAGMRERAALHGGTLDSGPAPEGGWRVAARLPWRDDR